MTRLAMKTGLLVIIIMLLLAGCNNETVSLNERPATVWEAARLRGVDFRAAGNEPSWLVEMTGNRAHIKLNYGQELLDVMMSDPLVNPEKPVDNIFFIVVA